MKELKQALFIFSVKLLFPFKKMTESIIFLI